MYVCLVGLLRRRTPHLRNTRILFLEGEKTRDNYTLSSNPILTEIISHSKGID